MRQDGQGARAPLFQQGDELGGDHDAERHEAAAEGFGALVVAEGLVDAADVGECLLVGFSGGGVEIRFWIVGPV